MKTRAIETDVFIAGGGPAGLAAAIAARGAGFAVTVAEQGRAPVEKACGEGLLPDAVEALEKLGVRFVRGEAVPFRGIRFVDGRNGISAEAGFENGSGLAVRRTTLHARLADCARAAGAALLWEASADASGRSGLKCDGGEVHARWMIGADGHRSPIRRWAGVETELCCPRYGFRQHFQIAPWTDLVEVYWGESSQAAVTPTGSKEIGVAVLSRNPRMRLQSALKEMPALAARMAKAVPVSRERGAPCGLRRLARVRVGEVALIGDASGSVDPVTGEGLGLSFQQAIALAEALRRGELEQYERAHRHIGQAAERMSRWMLLLDSCPGLRRAALRALAAEPALFARLLKANFGQCSAGREMLRLGWHMARPSWRC